MAPQLRWTKIDAKRSSSILIALLLVGVFAVPPIGQAESETKCSLLEKDIDADGGEEQIQTCATAMGDVSGEEINNGPDIETFTCAWHASGQWPGETGTGWAAQSGTMAIVECQPANACTWEGIGGCGDEGVATRTFHKCGGEITVTAHAEQSLGTAIVTVEEHNPCEDLS